MFSTDNFNLSTNLSTKNKGFYTRNFTKTEFNLGVSHKFTLPNNKVTILNI